MANIHEYKKLELLGGDDSGGSSGGGNTSGPPSRGKGPTGRGTPAQSGTTSGRSGSNNRGGLESSKSKSKSQNSKGGLESSKSKNAASQVAEAARSLADALDGAEGGDQNRLVAGEPEPAATDARRAKKADVVETKKRRAGKRVLGVPGDLGTKLNTLF